jgi:hypothetical protein
LRADTDINEVKNRIQEQIEDYFDLEKNVIPVTDNGGENLKNILQEIDMEELFKSIFIDDLKFNYFENEDTLNTIISTLKISKEMFKML